MALSILGLGVLIVGNGCQLAEGAAAWGMGDPSEAASDPVVLRPQRYLVLRVADAESKLEFTSADGARHTVLARGELLVNPDDLAQTSGVVEVSPAECVGRQGTGRAAIDLLLQGVSIEGEASLTALSAPGTAGLLRASLTSEPPGMNIGSSPMLLTAEIRDGELNGLRLTLERPVPIADSSMKPIREWASHGAFERETTGLALTGQIVARPSPVTRSYFQNASAQDVVKIREVSVKSLN